MRGYQEGMTHELDATCDLSKLVSGQLYEGALPLGSTALCRIVLLSRGSLLAPSFRDVCLREVCRQAAGSPALPLPCALLLLLMRLLVYCGRYAEAQLQIPARAPTPRSVHERSFRSFGVRGKQGHALCASIMLQRAEAHSWQVAL